VKVHFFISRMISKMIGISAAQGIAVAVTSGAVEDSHTASKALRAFSSESYSTALRDTVSSGTNFSIRHPANQRACLTRLGLTPNRAALTKSIRQERESSELKFAVQDIINFQNNMIFKSSKEFYIIIGMERNYSVNHLRLIDIALVICGAFGIPHPVKSSLPVEPWSRQLIAKNFRTASIPVKAARPCLRIREIKYAKNPAAQGVAIDVPDIDTRLLRIEQEMIS
jgi:hypothetical protein